MTRWCMAWLAALWLAAAVAHAQDYTTWMDTPFPIPDHYRLINDYNAQLRIAPRVALEKRLQALEKRNGTQIVFLSVPNTGPQGTSEYAQSVFKKWDIGNNLQGNGILVVVGSGQAVVLTGPGIAGAVPDVLVARLQRSLLAPIAVPDDVSDGIEQLIDALIKASLPETTHATGYDYSQQPEMDPDVMPEEKWRWIILLSLAATSYAGMLLWQYLRARVARR